MRLLLPLLAVLAFAPALAATPAQADPYKWCAVYGGFGNTRDSCYYVTLAQCQATVSGLAGSASQAPGMTANRCGRRKTATHIVRARRSLGVDGRGLRSPDFRPLVGTKTTWLELPWLGISGDGEIACPGEFLGEWHCWQWLLRHRSPRRSHPPRRLPVGAAEPWSVLNTTTAAADCRPTGTMPAAIPSSATVPGHAGAAPSFIRPWGRAAPGVDLRVRPAASLHGRLRGSWRRLQWLGALAPTFIQ